MPIPHLTRMNLAISRVDFFNYDHNLITKVFGLNSFGTAILWIPTGNKGLLKAS